MSNRMVGAIILVIFTAAAAGVLWSAIPAHEVSQPIAYSHAKHVSLGMTCEMCHTGAREGTHAGIPSTAFCAFCHKVDRDFPPTPKPMAKYLDEGKEIPWVQVHETPRHVLFSHRRHVRLADIDCAECHGEVKDRDLAFTRAAFPQGMEGMARCVDCHRREKVTTDCLSCHR